MDLLIKKICETKGYSLSEIIRTEDGKQDVLYEVRDPYGELYKKPESIAEALKVLKEIIFNEPAEKAN